MAPILPILAIGTLLLVSKNRSNTNPSTKSGSTIPGPKGTSGFGIMSQQDMQMVQHDLAWLGYFHGTMHGRYDESTANAIESFQDDHGIEPADGLPGPETLEMLDSVISAQP